MILQKVYEQSDQRLFSYSVLSCFLCADRDAVATELAKFTPQHRS